MKRRLGEARKLCVLSDYDGTLTPLADRPEVAELSGPTREVLRRMASNPRAIVGVVSGRSLSDLEARVRIPGLWYVGNHGFEIRTPSGDLQHFYEAGDVLTLNGVRDSLAQETRGIDGVQIEHKGPIVALHYRRVEAPRVSEVERAFMRVLEKHHRDVMMARGQCVFEARLRASCNKGTALHFVRRQLPFGTFVTYFGDDLTDRDAFRAVAGFGLSIQVGDDDAGLADYTLPDPASVIDTLRRLDDLLRERRSARRARPARPARRGR